MTRHLVDDAFLTRAHRGASAQHDRDPSQDRAQDGHRDRVGLGSLPSPQAIWAELKGGLQALERRALTLKWPQGLVTEVMERVILFVNHVLMHEPQALARLKRQQGRTLSLKWHDWHWRVRITPAGLLENDQVSQGRAFDRDLPHALVYKSDLTITLAEVSLLDVASRLVHEEKPAIRIEGDVQLAAEVNWLVGHVQWDYEDDLSKIVGDANAHQVVRVAHWVLDGLRRFATSAYDRASALGAGVANK